jgi:hypothetical protein
MMKIFKACQLAESLRLMLAAETVMGMQARMLPVSQWLGKPKLPGHLHLRIVGRRAQQRRFLRLRSGRSERVRWKT